MKYNTSTLTKNVVYNLPLTYKLWIIKQKNSEILGYKQKNLSIIALTGARVLEQKLYIVYWPATHPRSRQENNFDTEGD
jgi:hypothetical protein